MFTAQRLIHVSIWKKIAQEDGEPEMIYVHQVTQEHYVNNVTFMT